MTNNIGFWLWVGCGVLGWIILQRNSAKLVFDNPLALSAVLILMAGGAPFWGGPIFLVIVWLLPARQLCPHCARAIPEKAPTCSHCHRPTEILPQERAALEQTYAQQAAELAALAKQYGKWDWLQLPFTLGFIAILTLAWGWVLIQIGVWRFSFLESGVVQWLPPPVVWLFPAFFLSTSTSVVPMTGTYRLLLRERYATYQAYQRLKWPGASARSGVWSLGIVTAGGLLMVVLLLDAYVVARPNVLVINSLWGVGESHYAYSDIRTIRSSFQLETTEWEKPLYVINFRDGTRWSTRWEDRTPQEMADLMHYISQQSGIPIEQVPALYNSDV